MTFLRKLPRWLIFTALVAALVSSFPIYLILKRAPNRPSRIVLSACPAVAPGVRRIDSDFGTQFDVSEKDFTVHSEMRDMPPGTLYVVVPMNLRANIVIWRDDEIFNDLKSTLPIFSERNEERDIRTSEGSLVGEERWGYLNGERWRYVRFSRGDAVGYRPARPREASMLDQVIGSACFLATPRH
jgi:hypothetical protein